MPRYGDDDYNNYDRDRDRCDNRDDPCAHCKGEGTTGYSCCAQRAGLTGRWTSAVCCACGGSGHN